jgi:hypothetical protein
MYIPAAGCPEVGQKYLFILFYFIVGGFFFTNYVQLCLDWPFFGTHYGHFSDRANEED